MNSMKLNAKRCPEKYKEMRFTRNLMIGLEGCAGDTVSSMMGIIEKGDLYNGQVRLLTEIFPQFEEWHRQLAQVDTIYSQQCLEHHITCLKGPPNCQTQDSSGLLTICLNFLRGFETKPTKFKRK